MQHAWWIPDECVNFGDLDAIQFVDSHLDLRLVGTFVNNKHQCVVVLNLLHRRFCCQRILDDLELIQAKQYKDSHQLTCIMKKHL